MISSFTQWLLAYSRGDGLRAQLVRGALGVGGLKLLSLPLTLLPTILLARGLGPEGYGQYTFIVALVTTLAIPLGPALTQLITREAARLDHDGEVGRITLLLRWADRNVLLGSVLVAAVIGGLALWQVQWRVDDRWTLLLLGLFALPLLGLTAVRSGILTGLRRVVMGQLPELLVRPLLLFIVAGALLLIDTLNPATAIAAFLTGAGGALIVGVVLLRRVFLPEKQISGFSSDIQEQNKQWMCAWMPFTLLVTTSTLNAQIGILLLGWLSSNEQVAALQVAARGAMLVAFSLAIVNHVIGPHITQVHMAQDNKRLQAISRRSAQIALLVALLIALPLIFFGEPILSLMFGVEYGSFSTLPLAILAFGQLVNVGFGSVGMLLTMSGFERDTLCGQFLALIVNVVVAVMLIPTFGALGAAVAAAAALVTWNLIMGFMVIERLNIRPGVF